MRVYDFDETIYDGDSTRDFYFFCLKQYPRIARLWPMQLWHFLRFATGFLPKTQFKERFYRFFRLVPDMEAAVEAFWESHFHKIKDWYLAEKKPDDVVISASPAFLLERPCQILGITPPIASRVSAATGAYTGENCYGEEKAPRFFEVYPAGTIDAFFSDSLSDTPMALLAKESFIVRGNDRILWNEFVPSSLSRLKKRFLSPAFFRFLIVGLSNTACTTLLSFLFSLLSLHAVFAFAAGYGLTLFLSFLLNCFFTFKKRPSLTRFLKYALSYVPNFLVQCAVVWLFSGVWGLPELFSYAAAAILGVPLTFVLMQIFAFKK